MSVIDAPSPGPVGRRLQHLVGALQSAAVLVVLLGLAATIAAGWYTATHLGIDTDTTDMISADLDWRQDFIEFREAFPILWRSLVVVIDGDTADLAERARDLLSERIEPRDDLFVTRPGPASDAFFERQGLLFEDVETLEALSDRLAQIQPFLGRLSRDPTLRGFADMVALAARAGERDAALEVERLLREIEAALEAATEDRYHRFPWLELMTPEASGGAPDRRRLILLQPRLDPQQVAPARETMAFLYGLARELELDAGHGVEVRLTGPVALEYEELQSVSRGAGVASVATLVLVLVVLYTGLRSPTLVFAALVTLVCGLVLTGAFAAAAVGRLNLISVAFAVLYIGLGIDFSAHYCLRYRELLLQGAEAAQALRTTASDVGASLLLCAVTTSIGFFAFVPTAFTGVSELGLISGVGMYISLAANLLLLPALLHVLPAAVPRVRTRRSRRGAPTGAADNALQGEQTGGVAPTGAPLPLPQRRPRLVLTATALITVTGIALLRLVTFDPNPLNLKDPQTRSVTAYRDLLADSDTSPLTLSLLVDDLATARSLAQAAAELPTVASTRTLASFVPSAQEAKLALLQELAFIIGPDLRVAAPAQPLSHGQRLAALDTLQQALTDLAADASGDGRRQAEDALAALNRFRDRLETLPGEAATARLKRLEESLLAGFAPQLARLETALGATPITIEDLPQALTARWVTPDGRQRVELVPAENLADNRAMRTFVAQARALDPRATGLPVVQLGAGEAVVGAFLQAIVSALALVGLLLIILLRSLWDALRVIGPVMIASVLTASATVVAGIDFNFANVIALPLLLGMGVDNGIHLVHRLRTAPPPRGNLLATSTARAIVLSAVTTIVSFASLALSEHPGTASMGVLLAVGLGLILACTLLVLPALLELKRRKEASA